MKYLKGIAEVRPGYPFRGKLNEHPAGNMSVLQLKDIPNRFSIDLSSSAKIVMEHIKPKYLVEEKDIIFRSRGQTNTCAILPAIGAPVLCAAPLFHIRVKSTEVTPEYICWFINQPDAQAYFNRNAKGTSVRMIGRDALEDLPIDIPPLEKQREITAIAKLADQEQRLMAELAEKKKRMISGILARVASETGNSAENERLPEVVITPQEDMDNHSNP